MSPTTPVKRKSSMGPPSSLTPLTPGLATPRSVSRTPGTGESSGGRGRSQTPSQVKAEPIDPPSPSPRMARAPSALPPMSPSSRAMVPYRPRASTSTPSLTRKRSLGMLRDMSPAYSENRFASPTPSIPRARFPSSSRHRFPSETPSVQRSRRASSARSLSNFSLADSDTGSRVGRADTADYDRRGRNVRPRESRETSVNAPVAVASLPTLPNVISESTAIIVDIIADLYVQDVDADEDIGSKDKEDFKQDFLAVVFAQLFDEAGMSQRFSLELAEEEVVISARLIDRLIDTLKSSISDILSTLMKDYVTDGTKSKSKVARQSLWYSKYRATLPGLSGLLKDLTKNDAVTIVSLLAQNWSTSLPAFHAKLIAKSVNAKKSNCRTVTESVRKLSEMLVGDIYNDR